MCTPVKSLIPLPVRVSHNLIFPSKCPLIKVWPSGSAKHKSLHIENVKMVRRSIIYIYLVHQGLHPFQKTYWHPLLYPTLLRYDHDYQTPILSIVNIYLSFLSHLELTTLVESALNFAD